MFEKIPKLISKSETASYIGKIENVVGMLMEASGGRSSVGDIVMIYNEEQNCQIPAEVVGFKDGKIQIMTYETSSGITSGSFVRNTRRRLKVPVGDFLRGRIINALGEPIDGGKPIQMCIRDRVRMVCSFDSPIRVTWGISTVNRSR